jgi:hypothetical protein
MKSFFAMLLLILTLSINPKAQPATVNQMKVFTDMKGNWEGKVTLTLGEQVFNVIYLMDFAVESDGNAVVMNEKCNIPGVGKLYGANLIGFDPFDANYYWYSVDNFGTTHSHTGSFTDPTHFYMEHQSQRSGKTFLEKIWIEWLNPDRMQLKLVASTDGIIEEIAEGIFTRKGGRE